MQRIGLAGFGFIGKTHLEAYRNVPNAEVVAICTRSKHKELEKFTGDVLSAYEDLLIREDIDVIDICVPTFLHEEYVIKAARAKKNIICEKPLTMTVESCERILDVVREEGVRLFVGHVLRFWPEYQLLKEYTDTGELERIEMLHAHRLGQLPTWSDWFQSREKSGGALFDLHIHDIDFVYHLLGEVESVYAVGGQNQYGAWDHVMTMLTFENHARAFVEASHRMPRAFSFTMGYRAQSKEQVLDFQLMAGENIERMSDKRFMFYDDGKTTIPHLKETDAFINELTYFIDCLENDADNKLIPLEDVLYVIKLMGAIETSLETGTTIRLS